MLRLIYTSTQRALLSAHDLHALCDNAAENNRQRGLSGVLLYNGNEFLQCLEGYRNDLALVYEVIIRDPRHMDIHLLQSTPIESRLFWGWGMTGFMVSGSSAKNADINAYSLLDQRLSRPWRAIGQGCVDLIHEYAQVKTELDTAGIVKSFHFN